MATAMPGEIEVTATAHSIEKTVVVYNKDTIFTSRYGEQYNSSKGTVHVGDDVGHYLLVSQEYSRGIEPDSPM